MLDHYEEPSPYCIMAKRKELHDGPLDQPRREAPGAREVEVPEAKTVETLIPCAVEAQEVTRTSSKRKELHDGAFEHSQRQAPRVRFVEHPQGARAQSETLNFQPDGRKVRSFSKPIQFPPQTIKQARAVFRERSGNNPFLERELRLHRREARRVRELEEQEKKEALKNRNKAKREKKERKEIERRLAAGLPARELGKVSESQQRLSKFFAPREENQGGVHHGELEEIDPISDEEVKESIEHDGVVEYDLVDDRIEDDGPPSSTLIQEKVGNKGEVGIQGELSGCGRRGATDGIVCRGCPEIDADREARLNIITIDEAERSSEGSSPCFQTQKPKCRTQHTSDIRENKSAASSHTLLGSVVNEDEEAEDVVAGFEWSHSQVEQPCLEGFQRRASQNEITGLTGVDLDNCLVSYAELQHELACQTQPVVS